jgi:hypothetical protein
VSGDILDAIDQVVAEYEACPCGRELPADCPSFYWCSEACQFAWNLHESEPDRFPHPRVIRERAENVPAQQPAAHPHMPVVRPAAPRRPAEPATPVSGVLAWAPADDETAAVCAYTRWCPQCEAKRPPVTGADVGATSEPIGYALLEDRPLVQECSECRTRWTGRPLVGVVEEYHGPAFRDLIRLRLTDGFRSATRLISRRTIELWRAPAACLELEWEHLEEMLCDGVSDRRRQESQAGYRRARALAWDWRAFPIISDPRAIIRPDGIS